MANRSISDITFASMVWAGIGIGARTATQLAALMVLSRALTQTEYGVATAALTIFNLCWGMFEAGLGMTVLQRPNMDQPRIHASFTLSVLLGTIVPLSVAAFAGSLAEFFSMPDLEGLLYLLCAGMAVRSLTIVSEYLVQRDLNFRLLSIVETISFGVGFAGVAIVAALAGAGVWAVAMGQFGYCLLKSGLLGFLRPHSVSLTLPPAILRELVYYGVGFGLGSALATASQEADKILVGRLLGSAMLGVYGRAIQLFLMPAALLGQIVDRVIFAVLASVQSEKARVAVALKSGTAFFALIVLPGSAVVGFLAPEIVGVVLGSNWGEVVAPLQILCIGMYFRTSVKISEAILRARGAVYHRVKYYFVYTFLVVMGSLIGYRWGLTGVAVGIVVAVTAFFALMSALALRFAEIGVAEFLRLHVPGLLLTAIIVVEAAAALPSLREHIDSALLILTLAGVAATASAVLLCFLLPRVFIQSDARQLIGRLRTFVLSRSR